MERRITLKEAANELSAKPIDVLAWCSEGKMKCSVMYDGREILLVPDHIIGAKKRAGLIDVLPGAFNSFISNTGPRVPSLDQVFFLESEIARVKAEMSNGKSDAKETKQFSFNPGNSVEFLGQHYKCTPQWIIRGIIESGIDLFVLGSAIFQRAVETEWIRIDDRTHLKSYAYTGPTLVNRGCFQRGISETGKIVENDRFPYFCILWNQVYISRNDQLKFHEWVLSLQSGQSIPAQAAHASVGRNESYVVSLASVEADPVRAEQVNEDVRSELPTLDEATRIITFRGESAQLTTGDAFGLLQTILEHWKANPNNFEFPQNALIKRAKSMGRIAGSHDSIPKILRDANAPAKKLILKEAVGKKGFWTLRT